MKTRWIIMLGVSLFLTWPAGGFADDTQIYAVSGNVASKPNVLIIFDNNAGMGDSATTGDSYNPSTTYPVPPGPYISNGVYKSVTTNQNTSYVYMNMTLSGVTCASAKSGLAANGTWTSSAGSGLKSNGSCGKGGENIVYLGNLLNYNSAQSSGSSQTEVDAVRQALIGVDDGMGGKVGGVVNAARSTINFGLMVFGTNKSGGRIITPVQDLSSDAAYNAFVAALPPATPLLSGNGRPLAESLYDAGIYYQGDYSNSSLTITNQNGKYPSPITASCQKNFVIIITNGDTDGDNSPKLAANIGDFDGNGFEPGAYGSGTHYLDDVAKYLYERTLNPTGTPADQERHIITHTVLVFSPQKDLLELAADSNHGHGSYNLASDTNALSKALTELLASIVKEADTSYVAPVVPVSPENRTYSGDYIYIGFFRPSVDALWAGNVKKYKIVSGQIIDKDGAAATNSDGSFIDTSVSFWSAASDGGLVKAGGVGSVLLSMTLSPTANYDLTNDNMRKIYTYFGTNSQLKHTSNQFVTANASVTPTALGLGPTDTTGKDNLVEFIHGQDAYSGSTAVRDWILGDVLHSGPAVVAYSATRSVVYGGANDGMLHAFDDATGRELWAYIPNDQLATLWKLNGTVHSYFVDGSPKAYILDNNGNGVIESSNGDKVYLIFGERRGGTTYHAIDVTDPDDPQFLWDIKRGDSGLGELGQTWSTPTIKKIKISSGVKNVFFVGGGYDTVNEDAQPATTDTQGRSIYAIEVETGNRIWSYSFSNDSSMTYAIPSDVTALDTDRNGYVDRLYVGDVGGRMWRFDVSDTNVGNWSGRVLFKSNDASSHRKILYRPDVTRESGYYMLFFGTGDREHPLDNTALCNADGTGNCDRIYGVKDVDGSTATLTESNLVNVTIDDLQVTTSGTQVTNDLNNLAAMSGWFIALNAFDPGEKVVSAATLFNKVVSISTFEPTAYAGIVDPCLPNPGTGRVYEVNYLTGESVFNYYAANDSGYSSETNARAKGGTGEVLKREDRVKTVGAGMPSQVVMIIPENGTGTCDVMAIAGVGGGVAGLNAKCGGTTQRLFWRELFQ